MSPVPPLYYLFIIIINFYYYYFILLLYNVLFLLLFFIFFYFIILQFFLSYTYTTTYYTLSTVHCLFSFPAVKFISFVVVKKNEKSTISNSTLIDTTLDMLGKSKDLYIQRVKPDLIAQNGDSGTTKHCLLTIYSTKCGESMAKLLILKNEALLFA